MKIFSKISVLQNYLVGKNNVFVPTMGGLHQGHLSLIEIATNNAKIIDGIVVVSIFLNPAQFGKNEDLSTYPQSLEDDIVQLKKSGVDVVFVPTVEEIYLDNYIFNYQIGEFANILCAKSRPDFFPGIAKVVFRLFDIIKPKIAIFGEKDFQQLAIIKKMVIDLNLNIQILSGKIIRENSGLALSTRNKYLDKNSLKIASNIYKYLQIAKTQVIENKDIETISIELKNKLQTNFNLDYCEILDIDNLGKITLNTKNIIILVAVVFKNTRLIDNLIIKK